MPPSARYSFSCDTFHDLDVIEYLNSFAGRERGIAIKAALRASMEGEQVREGLVPPSLILDLGNIEEQVAELMRVMVQIKQDLAKLENDGTLVTNKDTDNKDIEINDPEITKNLEGFFN